MIFLLKFDKFRMFLITLMVVALRICCGSTEESFDQQYHYCGKQLDSKLFETPDESERIIRGDDVTQGEYPWMAYIILRSLDDQEQGCGGSIIADRIVLTAAHCCKRGKFTVTNVMIAIIDLIEGGYGQECTVMDYKMYPYYDEQTNLHDICLIMTKESFQIIYEPICLPQPDTDMRYLFDYRNLDVLDWHLVEVTGYGPTDRLDLTDEGKLKKVEIPVVPTEHCIKDYEGTVVDLYPDKFICAGGPQGIWKDSCVGDSGGPLMKKIYTNKTTLTSRYFQFGIVSFGHSFKGKGKFFHPCGKLIPAVYVRVTEYMNWITETAIEFKIKMNNEK